MENNILTLAQLSKIFREKRIKLGYDFKELSKLSAVSDRTCIKLENDAKGIKISTIKKVGKALGFEIKQETNFLLTEIAI